MAGRLPTAAASTNKGSFVLRHKLLTLCLLLIVMAVAGVIFWQVQQQRIVEAERIKFAQAESEIDALTERIIASVGQPLKVDKEKFCSRPNLKLEKGPLYCKVGSLLFYVTNDPKSASNKYKLTQKNIESIWPLVKTDYSNNMSKSGDFLPTDMDYNPHTDYQQTVSTLKAKFDSMECNVSFIMYESDKPPYSNFTVSTLGRYMFLINPVCAGNADREQYPAAS